MKSTGFVACLLLCGLVLALPAAAGTGKIAFAGLAGDGEDLFITNDDGSNPQRITYLGSVRHPSWSPDGTKIVFSADILEGTGLWMVNRDGSDLQNLRFYPGQMDRYPAWSPDGSKIAYSHYGELYVMDKDGSNPTPLMESGWNPTWSPDGRWLAFTMNYGGSPDIFLTNKVDPDSEFPLTFSIANSPQEDEYPAWSPDGKKIAFHSYRDGSYEIYVLDVPSIDYGIPPPPTATRLTWDTEENRAPSWSPDSRKIVYSGKDGNAYHLFVIDANGGTPAVLYAGNSMSLEPAWWGPPNILNSLQVQVEALAVPTPLRAGLLDKLNAAESSVQRGNTRAASNQLNAFNKQVLAQKGKQIPVLTANSLISQANLIVEYL